MINNLIINSLGNHQIYKFDDFGIESLDNVFIFFRNSYDEYGTIQKSFLEAVKEYATINESYIYKNIIIVPDDKNSASLYDDNIVYILWFAKYENSFFNKDIIREPHIWKNVEWGKRAKNYNVDGKDPSNVWIPTKDNGKGKITEHLNIKIEGSIDRLFTAFTNRDDTTKWFYYQNDLHIYNKENIKKYLRNGSNEFLEQQNSRSSSNRSSKDETDEYTNFKENHLENRIFFDTSENMEYIQNKVDLIVTSPPYWNLKDYFKEGQIGKETYEEYLNRMLGVWMECKKVMKSTATLWININIRKHKKTPYFIPTDYVEQLKSIGFSFKEVFIWHKSSSIPTNQNNLSDKFEVFLVFSLSDDILINTKELFNFNEYKNESLKYGTIWNINRKAGSIGKKFTHPAIYPTELIKRVILLSTLEGSLILDPFMGSGSSGIAALETKRKFIGVEYNEGFYELIRSRFISETKLSVESIEYFNRTMIFTDEKV